MCKEFALKPTINSEKYLLPYLPEYFSHVLMSFSPVVYSNVFTYLSSADTMKKMKLSDLGPIYVTDAYLGTPSKNIRIEFDTGSPAAYIYNKQGCATHSCPEKNLKFDTSASSSYTEDDSQILVQNYGRGHVEGYGASDVFCFDE